MEPKKPGVNLFVREAGSGIHKLRRSVKSSFQDRPVTEKELDAAIERGRKNGASRPAVVHAKIENQQLGLTFATGVQVSIPLVLLPEFDGLSQELRSQLEVGFVGGGLVVEAADLHVSVQGILEAVGVARRG